MLHNGKQKVHMKATIERGFTCMSYNDENYFIKASAKEKSFNEKGIVFFVTASCDDDGFIRETILFEDFSSIGFVAVVEWAVA